MAISLTTVVRVRQRLQLETWESNTISITQFIEDAEAMIKNYLGSLPASGDDNFDFAGAITTDQAAVWLGISLPTRIEKDIAKQRAANIQTLKKLVDENLIKLQTQQITTPLPRSSTGE